MKKALLLLLTIALLFGLVAALQCRLTANT